VQSSAYRDLPCAGVPPSWTRSLVTVGSLRSIESAFLKEALVEPRGNPGHGDSFPFSNMARRLP